MPKTQSSTVMAKAMNFLTFGSRDPASFPTEGAANPTFTIYALSLRGAERLATKWQSIAN